jgi:predicted nucleic acid-binding Zn ribbon protein
VSDESEDIARSEDGLDGLDENEAAAVASALALARARKAAADKGLRPGLRPLRRRRPTNQPPGTPSGSGPDARDPLLLGEQLEKFVSDRGWQVDVAVGSVIGRWPQIVGPDVAEHVQPVSFDDGVLTLRAASTAWATQMRLLTSVLLGRLEQEVGAGTVTEIVVTGPSGPTWAKGRRRAPGRGPRDTYG